MWKSLLSCFLTHGVDQTVSLSFSLFRLFVKLRRSQVFESTRLSRSPEFAAERRAAAPLLLDAGAVDRYVLPAGRSAAAVKRWDRQTDGRTLDRCIDPAPQTMRVKVKVRVAHTRLPSVGFRSWSRFLAVSLQVTWVINPAVICHYFPPGLQLPPQPSRRLLPVLLLGEQRHKGCEQFA